PPLVSIFHHMDFVGNKNMKRKGSEKDVERCIKTFEDLECQVEEVHNPTLEKIKETVGKLAVKDFNHLAGVVIIILSHGTTKEKIETCDRKLYDLDRDVLFPLLRNETLIGKPKILIIQACKNALENDSSRIEPVHTHFIKCYSTTEGLPSTRNPDTGSIYIQTFCNEMDQHALTKDFKAIIEDVNRKVEE
ncbi:hypothetical protein KR084_012840, partial [Drosophila pseudotakahashii]